MRHRLSAPCDYVHKCRAAVHEASRRLIQLRDVAELHRGQVQIQLPTVSAEDELPIPANFFHLSQVGGFVQLNVMFLDVTRLAISSEAHGKSPGAFVPELAGRFVMSLEGLALLQRQVNDLVGQIRAQGKAVNSDDIRPADD